jgi:hypothetical protein
MPWRAPGRAHQQDGQCEGTARVLGGDFLRQRGGQAAPPVGRGAQRHPGRVSGHVTAMAGLGQDNARLAAPHRELADVLIATVQRSAYTSACRSWNSPACVAACFPPSRVVERTHAWTNGYGKLRRCTERNAKIVDFYLHLAAALVTIRQLIQRARTRHRWDTRPTTKRLK